MIQNIKNKCIGLVLPSIPAYSETFFNSKIKGLQENGYDVILFTGVKSTNLISGVKIVAAPNFNFRISLFTEIFKIAWNIISNLKAAHLLYTLDRKEGHLKFESLKTIIINHHFLPFKLEWLHFGFGTMALQRENVAEAIGAKMAVSFRGFDLYIYPTKYVNCYETLFLKKVRYHVLSNEMKATLMEKGISEQLIYKITPAIDIKNFQRTKYIDFNLPLRFLTVGRLHWKKGLEYTLESLAHFKQKNNIPFIYTIVGEGVEKERLLFAAYQLGLLENVEFIGKVPHNEVKELMQQSHIYLQYSVQEGFCNSVIEAQSMGMLCIVSDADGLSENVINNETGWVVPKRNPEKFAEAILNVIKLDEKEKTSIKNNAIDRVVTNFNLEKQKKRV